MNKEIANRYKYHAPNQEQVEKYNRIREIIMDTAVELDFLCVDSPELEQALNHLDMTMMFANASIARNSEVNE